MRGYRIRTTEQAVSCAVNLAAGRHHIRTQVELRRECYLFPNLCDAALVGVVQEALEVEDEDGRERLDVDLLACVENGAWPCDGGELHGLGRGYVHECIFNGVDSIALDDLR